MLDFSSAAVGSAIQEGEPVTGHALWAAVEEALFGREAQPPVRLRAASG